MPKSYKYTEVDGQRLKLSNLEKQLYPGVPLIKAEVIHYYMKVADRLLAFAARRPLTLVRYPDGIEIKKFYTRNKPSWTPDWITNYQLDWDANNTYLSLHNKASLVWLANLAALEIHIMGCRSPKFNIPDHFVIDLDPSPTTDFSQLKDIAILIRDFLVDRGLVPYIKTSGGKGFHILVPTEKYLSFGDQIKAIKELLKPFVAKHKETTLKVHKTHRKDKILLDIYRNYRGNTTVCPFSLRGRHGAPASVPFEWDKLYQISSSQQFTAGNIDEWLDKAPSWEKFFENSRPIPVDNQTVRKELISGVISNYERKRNFHKTKEPEMAVDPKINGHFVLHLHNASNLHYDLRLGINGILKSWAIPKGLPVCSGIKRLAIQTEDHPPRYIDFSGEIPAGEYGEGTMWIIDKGSFHLESSEKGKKYRFQLLGKRLNRRYNLFQTEGDQWLIQMSGGNEEEVLHSVGGKHMLAQMADGIPNEHDYQFEVKWDGIRVFILKKGKNVTLLSRSGRNVSEQFPEICDAQNFYAESMIADGELVCLDNNGKPIFEDIISRMHSKTVSPRLVQAKPAILYLFDLLYFDGFKIEREGLEQRREWLKTIIKTGKIVRYSKTFIDGRALFQAVSDQGIEGIIAKRKGSVYSLGRRSPDWLKYKVRASMDCKVIGYTEGQGDRSSLFGSLHIAEKEPDKWIYRGRVGTGFDQKKLTELFAILSSVKKSKKLIKEKVEEEKKTSWIEPVLDVNVEYASITQNGTLREPVFVKIINKKQ